MDDSKKWRIILDESIEGKRTIIDGKRTSMNTKKGVSKNLLFLF